MRRSASADSLRRRQLVGLVVLVDADLLQVGDDRFLEVLRLDCRFGDLAQSDNRVLVAVAVDGELGAARNLTGALRAQQDQIEPVQEFCRRRSSTVTRAIRQLHSNTRCSGKGSDLEVRRSQMSTNSAPGRAAPCLPAPPRRRHKRRADRATAPPNACVTVDDNRLTLLTEGPERLAALLELIDGADAARCACSITSIAATRRASWSAMRSIARSTAGSSVALLCRRLRLLPTPDGYLRRADRQGPALLPLPPRARAGAT